MMFMTQIENSLPISCWLGSWLRGWWFFSINLLYMYEVVSQALFEGLFVPTGFNMTVLVPLAIWKFPSLCYQIWRAISPLTRQSPPPCTHRVRRTRILPSPPRCRRRCHSRPPPLRITCLPCLPWPTCSTRTASRWAHRGKGKEREVVGG